MIPRVVRLSDPREDPGADNPNLFSISFFLKMSSTILGDFGGEPPGAYLYLDVGDEAFSFDLPDWGIATQRMFEFAAGGYFGETPPDWVGDFFAVTPPDTFYSTTESVALGTQPAPEHDPTDPDGYVHVHILFDTTGTGFAGTLFEGESGAWVRINRGDYYRTETFLILPENFFLTPTSYDRRLMLYLESYLPPATDPEAVLVAVSDFYLLDGISSEPEDFATFTLSGDPWEQVTVDRKTYTGPLGACGFHIPCNGEATARLSREGEPVYVFPSAGETAELEEGYWENPTLPYFYYQITNLEVPEFFSTPEAVEIPCNDYTADLPNPET